MMILTSDPTIRELVEATLEKGNEGPNSTIRAWNARIRLSGPTVTIEGATAIYLDHVLTTLRVYLGREAMPPGWRCAPVHIHRREGKGIPRSSRVAR